MINSENNDHLHDESIEKKNNESLADSVEESSGKASNGEELNDEIEENSSVPAADDSNSDAVTDPPDESEEPVELPSEEEKTEVRAVKVEKVKEERVKYDLLNQEDLVRILADMLNNKSFNELRDEVDEIRDIYTKRHEEELEEKKQNFIAEGGLEQDFKPAEDPLNNQMNELLEKYKILKSDFNKQLEDTKETNLAAKQEILEEFRLLMEGQESFDTTFRKFKQLQTRWFEVGIIPKQNVKDLWNSYNYFVDKFNDYVKINRELRLLDLKKNLDQKVLLCERAEALAKDPNVANSFKALQKLHNQWRDAGPVPREDKDAIWERFKAATSKINKAHQELQSELKDSLLSNLELKKGLCEKVELIAKEEFTEHREWVENTTVVLDLQKEWKTIGYAPKKDNNLIYARFRKACDQFFEKKASFYAETQDVQRENLEQKRQIVVAAEALKDSTDWKSTTDKLVELQKKWKKVGPVPKRESDRLWKKFRAACDHFFHSKSEFFGNKSASYDDNLKLKQGLITELGKYKASGNTDSIITDLERFQERYNEIGFVPVEKKDKIRDQFRDAMNSLIDNLAIEDADKGLIRFRLRVESLAGNPKTENKLHFEREKLMSKLQQLRSDISVWENNIGFFKQTKSSESTIADFNEKIEDARSRIELLEKKIKTIDEVEDDI